jgi:hypothetical protein
MSNHGSALRRTARQAGSLVAATTIVLAFAAQGVSAAGPKPTMEPFYAQGVVHAKGEAHTARPNRTSDLLWHNGTILTGTPSQPIYVQAIFWGTSWNSSPGDKISGMNTFYNGVGGSSYLHTTTEYTGTNGQVGTAVSYQGSLVDPSAAPSKAPSTSTIQAEVAKLITNPIANAYYPVYIDQPRGNAGYCAWHSFGSVNGVLVEFGFFFDLDGDPGCDPGDPGNLHSQGLEAIANVSGHELSETLTDPTNGGWWDRNGAENADKCAWTFGGNVTFGGTSWKIQGNYSNAAAAKRSGYDHAGCIQTS